jgi:hypothetical protein
MAKPSVSELFRELATEFKLEPKLAEWLTAESGLAAKSLEDFAYAASSEDDVTRMVTAAKPDNTWLATSRLRQAWKSVKRSCDDEHVIRRSGMDTTDLDELLPAPELEDIESRHWARYKMTWPPEIAPADSLVSRAVRELGKRALSVMDVDKVRTQAHQQRAVRKRTKLANGVEMLSAEAEEEGCCSTLHAYMANLLTLMIAYSKAGSRQRKDAPTTEPKTCDSTRVVECPLDVLMRYVYRVQNRAARLPHHAALAWVRAKDEAERTVWVDRFRNSTETLGEIVVYTMQTREAMWEPPTPEHRLRAPTQAAAGGPPKNGAAPKSKPAKPPAQQAAQGQAEALRDGTRLCRAFNAGKCTRKDCKYKHACNKILASGRPCGARHASKDHR